MTHDQNYGPLHGRPERRCECGAVPDVTETFGTGDFIDENGKCSWLCLACWCKVNYGDGALETLEARRQAKKPACQTCDGHRILANLRGDGLHPVGPFVGVVHAVKKHDDGVWVHVGEAARCVDCLDN